jgi:ribosomal protein L29
MKKKEFTELRSKDIKVLQKLVFEKKAEAVKTKVGMSAGKEKNLKIFRNLRREVAQILTLIKEKEIAEKLQPKKEEKS